MENMKGSLNTRNVTCSGKHPLLPPKSPFPSISPTYVDYVPSPAVRQKGMAKSNEVNSRHHRTSSESFLMEEQPSWLDELLDEPETPVRRGGHRRSSSDSFAYIDAATAYTVDTVSQDEYKYNHVRSVPSWESRDFEQYKDVRHASFYTEPNSLGKPKNRAHDPSLIPIAHTSGLSLLPVMDNGITKNSRVLQEADRVPSTGTEKQDAVESGPRDLSSFERMDHSHAMLSASETDTKRAKQQFAQRSRVRKLQYIAELESNVQALQAEGSEISADLEFRNQQNLILTMENKALKQRLESLAQEQLIKYLEHEVLEREINRLQSMYQQQQQQQPSSSHRRTKSRDLDSQFANLSLKHKDPSSGTEPVSGPLQL